MKISLNIFITNENIYENFLPRSEFHTSEISQVKAFTILRLLRSFAKIYNPKILVFRSFTKVYEKRETESANPLIDSISCQDVMQTGCY